MAGPVAALALQQAGIEVVVHEAHAPADGEVGSWLTVTPNGLDALEAVGSLHLAREIGHPTRANIMRGATGASSDGSRWADRSPTAHQP